MLTRGTKGDSGRSAPIAVLLLHAFVIFPRRFSAFSVAYSSFSREFLLPVSCWLAGSRVTSVSNTYIVSTTFTIHTMDSSSRLHAAAAAASSPAQMKMASAVKKPSTSPLAQKLFHQTTDALQRVRELRSLQSGTKNVTRYIAQLQANIADAEGRATKAQRELAVAQRDVAAAQKRMAGMETSLEAANQKIEQIRQQSIEDAFTAKEELNRSARKSSDLKRQIRELGQDVDGCRQQLLGKQNAIEELERANAEFDNELKQLRAQHAAALRAHQRETESAREELSGLRSRNQALQTQAVALTNALDSARENADHERTELGAQHAEELERSRQTRAKLTTELQACRPRTHLSLAASKSKCTRTCRQPPMAQCNDS